MSFSRIGLYLEVKTMEKDKRITELIKIYAYSTENNNMKKEALIEHLKLSDVFSEVMVMMACIIWESLRIGCYDDLFLVIKALFASILKGEVEKTRQEKNSHTLH